MAIEKVKEYFNQFGIADRVQEFQLPDTLEPINILAVGYLNEPPADPERHNMQRIPLSELVHYEKL